MIPFFSIVIPTLNEEKRLPNLLSDLSKQKEKNFEVLIIDGNSEDKTVLVASRYQDDFQHFEIIKSDRRNLCHQRNFGAKQARGEYLIFMDADIRIYSNYLLEVKKTIDKHAYLFLTTYQLPDNRENFDKLLLQLANYSLEVMRLINKQMAPGYNFIIFKDVFEKVGGFNEKATISEDHELSMRIQSAGVKLYIIPKRILKWSVRRIKQDGYLPIMIKYSIATFYSIMLGEITDKKLGYQMGGQHFAKNKKPDKKVDLEIKKYFLRIRKLADKLF